MRIEVLGLPFNGLRKGLDVENPADGLRQTKLVSQLESNGHSVTDLGDLPGFQFQDVRDPGSGIKDFELWINLSEAISNKLAGVFNRGAFPLLLGGDCSMLVGIFLNFARKDKQVGLVFLDGHADYHTPETSPSGDPADMELAVLTGRGHPMLTGIAGRTPLLREDEVVVYGIRDWDQIEESNISTFSREQMVEKGIETAVAEGLERFTRQNLPLWLHFDVDVLDPEFMPVMFPEPGGLTFEETRQFLNLVWESRLVMGMSIACYHPRLDEDGSAGAQLVALITEVIKDRSPSK